MAEFAPRPLANILVTGTPGTGKTSTAEMIAEKTGLKHFNVGEFVKVHKCHESYDEEFDTHILDEDKLLDLMEEIVGKEGGYVVDYHSCELFPERWIDLVLVLTSDTNVLHDRLTERGYNKRKIEENMQCEIMMVVSESAFESYPVEMVHKVPSNNVEDIDSNAARAAAWLTAFKKDKEKN